MSPRLLHFPAAARAAALALALLAIGCSEPNSEEHTEPLARAIPSRETGVKILVVGIDGATFKVMDPLLEAAELPTFASLIARGSRGTLISDRPMRSPALWTTMATGRTRDQHGIVSFTVEDEATGEPVLVNSTLRRSLNVWDILGAAGRSIGVVGWWATWPAEPVRGWLVSDRMTRSRWSEWSDGLKQDGLVYPPDLTEELLPLVVDPLDPPMEIVRSIIELDDEDEAEFRAATRPVRAHGLSVLKFALANQLTYERVTDHQFAKGQPDFSAVFLIANDAISHNFWHYHEPEQYESIPSERLERLAPVLANVYRHNDAYLATLLEKIDDSTVVLVVSDHGFKASGKLPSAGDARRLQDAFSGEFEEGAGREAVTVGQSGIHHPDGVWIAAGGPIVAGASLDAALVDLTPTILALMGLPVPEDLPGRVLTEIIDPAFLENFPVEKLPTYERLVDRRALRAAAKATADGDEGALEMLRSLGYIQ